MAKIGEERAKEAGCKLLTFGSYKLGVHGHGTDIDAVVVCPYWMGFGHFFYNLADILKKRNDVNDLQPIKAVVSILKFSLDGVEIDLLFAKMRL